MYLWGGSLTLSALLRLNFLLAMRCLTTTACPFLAALWSAFSPFCKSQAKKDTKFSNRTLKLSRNKVLSEDVCCSLVRRISQEKNLQHLWGLERPQLGVSWLPTSSLSPLRISAADRAPDCSWGSCTLLDLWWKRRWYHPHLLRRTSAWGLPWPSLQNKYRISAGFLTWFCPTRKSREDF